MSACHLDTKQVTPLCFEMFPLTSPQIKFSGGGGGGVRVQSWKYATEISKQFQVKFWFWVLWEWNFFLKGGGGVVDPYKMTLIVNRWQTGSVGLSYMYEYIGGIFFCW